MDSHARSPVERPEMTVLDPREQLSYLWQEWRLMARPENLAADLTAAIAVALVAVPLSLAIASGSGVAPQVGLVTAVVGGIVVALFGGSRLQVSGPAAAMLFLVAEIIAKFGDYGREHGHGESYGLVMLIAATMMAGLFQLVAGTIRLGRLMQFIPRPVIAGFLTGIGVTILCSQVSVVLGYSVPRDEEGGAFAMLWQTLRHLDQTNPRSLIVGGITFGLMFLVPRISRRLPTPLIAVAVATLLPWALGWTSIRVLGELPRSFPTPTLPEIPWDQWNELVMASLTIALLASIESLLSASVVDSMARVAPVDHDQELIGQGLGNLASSLFAGLPVTGVIARSATNVQSGARTRLAAIAHAGMILAMMFVLGPIVAYIPYAALAGVLCAVAVRMVEVKLLTTLWRGSRAEAAVYLVTAGAILVTDLIDGVQVGLVATFLYFIWAMSRQVKIRPVHGVEEPALEGDQTAVVEKGRCPVVRVWQVEGPLFFASGFYLRNVLRGLGATRSLVLDLDRVPFLDVTGAEILEETIEWMRKQGCTVVLTRVAPAVKWRIDHLAGEHFRILRETPICPEMVDAMRHVARLNGQFCANCRDRGTCVVIEETLDRFHGADEPVARLTSTN
jgi:high affinity sulfate transporter 1